MAKDQLLNAKAEEIRSVLSEPTVDLWKLRELALSDGGLVNDSLRKLAWPKLVGLNPYAVQGSEVIASVESEGGTKISSTAIEWEYSRTDISTINNISTLSHLSHDHEQIERDVSRVTWHLLTGNQRSRNFQMKNKGRKKIAQILRKKQRRLGDYLNLVLVLSYAHQEDGSDEEADRLRYYQGYHDVASIVLSTLGGATLPVPPTSSSTSSSNPIQSSNDAASSMGLSLACQFLVQLSQSHLRDSMRSNFYQLQTALKLIVMPLLATFDSQLHQHLLDCEMEPYFCLSWIITWFSHDVRDTSLVKRLYDCFIVGHPLLVVYMSVAMMIHPLNRIEVLGSDCDFACVHNALANLPKNSSNVGLKYLSGDSCNDKGGEDDETTSLNSNSLMDQSFDTFEDDESFISLNGVSRNNRVPFQELIDLSIDMMHKIPPRNLLNLARRYYDEVTLQPLMVQSSSIAMLQPPPSWALTTHTDSDWVLRQRLHEESGKTKLNRHQRKNRSKLGNGIDISANSTSSIALVKPSLEAIIASGTGPDGHAEARRLRKKRRLMGWSAAVVVLAAVVAISKNNYRGSLLSTDDVHLAQDWRSLTSHDDVAVPRTSLEENVESVAEVTVETEVDNSLKVYVTRQEEAPQTETVKPDNEVSTSSKGGSQQSTIVLAERVSSSRHFKTSLEYEESMLVDQKKQATLKLILWNTAQFLRNIALVVERNYAVKQHMEHLEHHVSRVLVQMTNLLRIAWQGVKFGWERIAPRMKKELVSMIEGGGDPFISDAASKTWRKQWKARNKQVKGLGRVIFDVSKRAKKPTTKTVTD